MRTGPVTELCRTFEHATWRKREYRWHHDWPRLADILGRQVSHDLMARLRYEEQVATGPRAPRQGALHFLVTEQEVLAKFDPPSFRDLSEKELGEGMT